MIKLVEGVELMYAIISLSTVALAELNAPTAVCMPAAAHVMSGFTTAGRPLRLPATITPVIIFTKLAILAVSVGVTELLEVIIV